VRSTTLVRILLLASLLASAACQSSPVPRTPPAIYGVIFRVQVAPDGTIEVFRMESIVDPFGNGPPSIADDWLTTACMAFEIGTKANPTPTYAPGEPPTARFTKQFYDADRPAAFFGEDPRVPVLTIPAGVASEKAPDDLCTVDRIRASD